MPACDPISFATLPGWRIIAPAALATLAGALYGLDKVFKPFVYMQLLLPIFASAVVGGIGQPIGAQGLLHIRQPGGIAAQHPVLTAAPEVPGP